MRNHLDDGDNTFDAALRTSAVAVVVIVVLIAWWLS